VLSLRDGPHRHLALSPQAPPWKRAKAAPSEGSVIVRAADPAKARRRVSLPTGGRRKPDAAAANVQSDAPTAHPANDDRKPAIVARDTAPDAPSPGTKSSIFTARKPGKRYAAVPEVSEEEHRRIGDLADAMMAEFKRMIAERNRA
jgi:hypothetical protein